MLPAHSARLPYALALLHFTIVSRIQLLLLPTRSVRHSALHLCCESQALCKVQVKVTLLQSLQEQVLHAVAVSLQVCSNLHAQMHGRGAL